MSNILKELEKALISDAQPYTPEGSEPKAIVHQWVHAISHDLPLFGEARGAKKSVIIKRLKDKGLFKNKTLFHQALTAHLPIAPPKKAKFTFIDLFAGIGGIRIGAQNNGGVCVFSSEFDTFSQETYLDNHGELPFGDITRINEKLIPNHDVLFAGFPCQPFSYAGRCEGFEDKTRGTLFFDVLRILEEKKPKVVVLENVKGFKSHQKGETLHIALKALEEAGYKPKWTILNSYDFGVPQYRERWYCVATRTDNAMEFPQGILRGTKLRDIIDPNEKDTTLNLNNFELERIKYHFSSTEERVEHDNSKYASHTKKGKHGVFSFQKKDGALRFHVGDRAKTQIQEAFYACLDTYSPTIIANRTPKLWDIKRKLSVKEATKLQGFPSSFRFTVSSAQAYKQLGNTVTIPVIEALVKKLVGMEEI